MKEHLRRSFLYKHSQFSEDNDDRANRPFKNVIRPILNIQYRTEGFDVKDIELYVNNSDNYWKSYLVDKFHEKWTLENQMDTFIDAMVESFVDYGGVLVKNVNEKKPEVVDLLSLAFCDQTSILSGPFGIKHNYNPQELRDMAENGWGDSKHGATISIDALIKLSEPKKQENTYGTQPNATPGKYIEIYEIHGVLPEHWLNYERNYSEENEKDVPQIQICAFYKDKDNHDQGVTLFASKEPKLPFKFLARDKVWGRALGFGGVEELFEAQTWTNDNEIKMQEMLQLASKTFFKTTDQRFKTRNNLRNLENGEILDLQNGTDINQLDTTPRNLIAFNNAVALWQQHAEIMGAAGEALQGQNPSAGTPFKLQELVTVEAKGLHIYRQGKLAVFLDEIYREWILPYIKREITRENEFLAELSVDELQDVARRIAENRVDNFVKELILDGQLIDDLQIQQFKAVVTDIVIQKGNKQFLKILKDEFAEDEIDVLTNVAGKQKSLAQLTDKVVNLVRQVIATPQLLEDPYMVKLLNTILESSGLSPIMYGASPRPLATQKVGGSTEPLKGLAESKKEEAALAVK